LLNNYWRKRKFGQTVYNKVPHTVHAQYTLRLLPDSKIIKTRRKNSSIFFAMFMF